MSETKITPHMQSFVDKFVEFSARLANQVHLRSLRDAFATVMPIFILAGLAVLVNNVVFPWILEGDTLTHFKVWGEAIINGTLNIAALLLAPMIAWSLARNKDFDNPVSAVVIAVSSFIIMMPMRLQVTPVGSDAAVNVTQVLTFANIGSTGIFAGVLIGLLSTELFIAISRLKALHISLGENVPPAVSKSFTALIPTILTLSLFAVLAAVLANVLHTDLIHLITTFIQQPLRLINTSLPGTIFIYSFGNFLFTLGIHQSVVNSVVLEPFLLINTNENMLAFANGQPIPHIINNIFVPTFGMVGDSPAMQALLNEIALVAPSDATVLIHGESGTGKELVAHQLHELSHRKDNAFVEVNCAAIPSELIESELFGHEKGSFTSAIKQKKGKFELATGGTLFLDEIGDMSLSAQAKVLRALQEQKITRVGGDADINVDVRVIAATNKNLKEEIKKGNFREDLYHRLSVIIIDVPPLNQRLEDIEALASHFLTQVCTDMGIAPKSLSPDAISALKECEWTGNIRELRNVVERLVILCGNTITREDVRMYR